MTKQKAYGYSLMLVLFGISLLKDLITPDYLNTPEAAFLNPQDPAYTGILESHVQYPMFWIKAYLYSLLFIIIPSGIFYCLIPHSLVKITIYIFVIVFVLEYLLLFSGNRLAIVHIVPKINRYFHSPILTLFLLASYTLYNRYEKQPD